MLGPKACYFLHNDAQRCATTDGRTCVTMAAKANLTAEQEQDICRRAERRERYESIAASYRLNKSSIARVVQRAEARAMAAPVPPLGVATDPQTGIEVEITDDAVMGHVMRSLMREFLRDGCPLADRIAIAHVLPKLATARQKVRTPQPTQRQTMQPTAPVANEDEELVRFH